jgi:hypothetical protein
MPLAFPSLNQGTVAFGFFNIESDMLLLERHFFFAGDFCGLLAGFALREDPAATETLSLDGYTINSRDRIGDLMGAIHGIRHTGFIGELYRLFPFPERPEDFRQNPDGHRTRERVSGLIAGYASPTDIPVKPMKDLTLWIGDCRFDRAGFQALIRYVWEGGYPGWKDGRRPTSLLGMKEAVDTSVNPFFAGMEFGP